MNNELQDRHNKRRSLASAMILGWLIDQGCELSEETLSALPDLRATNPHWQPNLDKIADEKFGEVTGGTVDIEMDPTPLLNVPLSEVIDLVESHPVYSSDFSIEYRPFDGLVRQHPRRAVAALTLATKRNQFPEELWKSLLREWPDTAPPRLSCLLSERVKQLPDHVVTALRHDVFSWMAQNESKLKPIDKENSLDVLDTLLDKLFAGDTDATNNPILSERVAGDDQGWSRKTMFHAINGPVGKAVEILFAFLRTQNLTQGSGVPPEIESKFERLLTSPGEGPSHAVCLLCRHIEWLYWLDPDWVSSTVVPWFDPEHPDTESAWNGYCHANRLPNPELFLLLKPHFLNVFSVASTWKWNDQAMEILHNHLVIGCLRHEQNEAYLSVDETRSALQKTTHSGRGQCIHYLTKLLEDDETQWDGFGRSFLNEAWPKENQMQSETTTTRFAFLASAAGSNFPDVVHTITPRLVHVHRNSWFIYHVFSDRNETSIDLIACYPSETLTFIDKIIPNNPQEIPFNLNVTLEKIAQSQPTLRQNSKWQRLNNIVRNA